MNPWLILLTIAGYFVLLFAVSRVASRKSGNTTFFTGDRNVPWPVVAFATIGAAISGVTFISVPGMTAAKGYSYLQMALGFTVGYAAIAFLLVPLFYKRNLVSIYGYLEERFGTSSYRTGAWYFFISKMLGASVRFFVVCIVLQELVCRPLGIPFAFNVAVTVGIVWLYTCNGGVKSVIWTDVLKSFCLISSVVLCIWFIARNMGLSAGELTDAVIDHRSSRVFFFDNPSEGTYFWKQFLAGIFMVIATTGLDQDMMQRNLACRDSRQSQKNMMLSSVMQLVVIALFLVLGTLLTLYIEHTPGLDVPGNSDETFGLVASHDSIPLIVGVLFIIGLVSAAYSAAGSALTSLTTSFTIDILGGGALDDGRLTRTRRLTHLSMALTMGTVIYVFHLINEDDAISAVYTLASYTYGPVFGLFAFGMACRRQVADRLVPAVCVASPLVSIWLKDFLMDRYGYQMSFELLIFNAAITFTGLAVLSLLYKKPEDAVIKNINISTH
ncbi:MAG: sodium:solute symporter [Pseudoflavonifractor sp.]|nr:sodium:solute symporter [Pseudoflavonifractor sp.]